jgi:IS1 family transposase
MDELYWFVFRNPKTEIRGNVYITILVSRSPRQIVGFDVVFDTASERIQKIADNAPNTKAYATDGFLGCLDVVYFVKHIRNVIDKSDTFIVEGINADIRHYIPVIARRSRCFIRTLETLLAVVSVFIEVYNRFRLTKQHFFKHRTKGEPQFGLVDFP